MASSTSTTPPSPSVSGPDNTPGNSNPNQPAPQSSSLYLFTFLATLLLLLAVSCAIVIRSFILRRRFRRRIEEALAAGVLIPGALEDGGGMGRGRRRDFGEKPKLWEVWVDDEQGHAHNGTQGAGSEGDNFGKGEGKWEEIQPVSATILTSKSAKPSSLPGAAASQATSAERQRTRQVFISRLLGRRPIGAASPAAPQDASEDRNESAAEPNGETGLAKEPPKEDEKVQVSVLISMPNPNSRRTQDGEAGSEGSVKGKGKGPGVEENDGEGENDIPDVVFGVAEVHFRP